MSSSGNSVIGSVFLAAADVGGVGHPVAYESGARIIAVAAGRDTADDLTAAGADMVLDDLTDTRAVLTAIYRQTA
jgi:hypothetical protein